MPRLILLNGPPGSGKSTLARRYVEEHRFALALDIDQVRGLIGGWRNEPTAAGLMARRLALAMARAHLSDGYDVIVPQYLGQLELIEALEQLAADLGARFDEIVLLDDREAALERFHQRRHSRDPVHQDAQHLVDEGGGPAYLAAMYDRLVSLLDTRPRAVVVRPHDGDAARTYRELLERLT